MHFEVYVWWILIILFCVSEEEPITDLMKKEQLKSKWDDEDLDDNDVKESWEDEEEPTPV